MWIGLHCCLGSKCVNLGWYWVSRYTPESRSWVEIGQPNILVLAWGVVSELWYQCVP
jgi:hypothetical protein